LPRKYRVGDRVKLAIGKTLADRISGEGEITLINEELQQAMVKIIRLVPPPLKNVIPLARIGEEWTCSLGELTPED